MPTHVVWNGHFIFNIYLFCGDFQFYTPDKLKTIFWVFFWICDATAIEWIYIVFSALVYI